jgi:tetratricopeptide (TPR) repeat protein
MARTFAALMVSFIVCAASARAQEDARARAHYDAAQAHVAAERYDEAYAEFSAGFELSQRPAFLFNMGECALHAGRRDQARADYARYLERAPTGAMSDIARRRLGELGPVPAPVVASPAPEEPTPAEVARAESDERAEVLRASALAPTSREIWQEDAFWIVGATVLALAIGGAIAGGVVASESSNGPMCGAGCVSVDFR